MIINRPSILIYAVEASKSALKEICAGIEEEGVLYEVVKKDKGSAKELAYAAANESVLGSGIGIFKTEMALQMRNIKMEKPVFYSEKEEESQCRKLGINSARAVKHRPFQI
ncbi:MAG TPA: glycerol dehydratase reactivase beta/small subunit family protein [Lachnospiraceae bacterium]